MMLIYIHRFYTSRYHDLSRQIEEKESQLRTLSQSKSTQSDSQFEETQDDEK